MAAVPEVECEFVPGGILARIGEGAEANTGMALTGTASAYRSADFEKVYFVAAKFVVSGVADELVGVWATNSIDEASPGVLMAVDGMAQEFTVYPDADTTDAAISSADPSVQVAIDCMT